MAAVGHRPREPWLLRRILESVAGRAGEATTRGLVQALEGAARMGFYPGADLLDVVLAALQQRMMAAAAVGQQESVVMAVEEEERKGEGEGASRDDAAGGPGAFGPPDTKGLATLVRALLRLSHHPGRDFLLTLELALARVVAHGARLAWAPMALAAFGHRPRSGGGSSRSHLHRALFRGLMTHDDTKRRGASTGATAVAPGPRRITTLTLSQLAALLWGLAAIDGGGGEGEHDGLPTERRLARRLMAEACVRLQGHGPKPRGSSGVAERDGEEEEEEEGPSAGGGKLECDLDALTVHARLRQAGLYFAHTHAQKEATTEAEQRQLQLPARFLRLVEGYRQQCLAGEEEEGQEGEDGAAMMSPECLSLRGDVQARIGAWSGWKCHVPRQVEDGGRMGWLDTPDLVVEGPSRHKTVALVLLLPGQYFASRSIEEDGCDYFDGEEEEDGCILNDDGEAAAMIRPLGAAAFRLRVLKARWGARRVVVVTPDGLHDLESRLHAAASSALM